MASKDDDEVQRLLSDFDFRYALEYLYNGDTNKAQAYVDRNPGLKERREKEYLMYKGD